MHPVHLQAFLERADNAAVSWAAPRSQLVRICHWTFEGTAKWRHQLLSDTSWIILICFDTDTCMCIYIYYILAHTARTYIESFSTYTYVCIYIYGLSNSWISQTASHGDVWGGSTLNCNRFSRGQNHQQSAIFGECGEERVGHGISFGFLNSWRCNFWFLPFWWWLLSNIVFFSYVPVS